MDRDYWAQSELVIVYEDEKGLLSTTKTNRILKKGFITLSPDEDSDYKYVKIVSNSISGLTEEELKQFIENNTYKEIIYNDNTWINKSCKKIYLKEINIICPRMVKLVKIYKDHSVLSIK